VGQRVNLQKKYDYPDLEDPALPLDNNFDEQQSRPWASGRKNRRFAGMLMAAQRAAVLLMIGVSCFLEARSAQGRKPSASACKAAINSSTMPARGRKLGR
jgi:hypothetical protein